MNAFSSKSLSDNPKPVLSRVEGSAIPNRKWLELWVFILVLLLTGLWFKRSSRQRSFALGSWIQVLLLVARSSWRRSDRSLATLVGSRERISASSTDLQRENLGGCLTLPRT